MKGAIGKHMMSPGKMMEGESHKEAMESGEGMEHSMAGGDPGKPPPKKQGEQTTPEGRDAYERAVLAGVDVIFDKATQPGILNMLQSGAQDPAQAIAQATALVIQILEEKSKGQLPGEIILDLADELAGNVMALGAKNGLFTADENLKGKTAQQVNLLLSEMYETTPEDAEEMVAGMPEEELASIQQQQAAFAGGA